MRLQSSLLFFLVCFISTSYGQIEEKDELRNEFSIGINTNTNGALISGINFRYTYALEPKKFNLFSFEFVNVKHEQEERFSTSSGSFIPGKISYLLAFRPSYGKEYTIFQKAAEDGIRLNFTFSGGPTIGIVKPYMIEYTRFNANSQPVTSIEAYDPNIHSFGQITGDGGVFDGFDAAKANLGLHARTSLNFEYGPFPNLKIGAEAGTTFEAYSRPNILLINNEERSFYSAFFFHLYYGFSF